VRGARRKARAKAKARSTATSKELARVLSEGVRRGAGQSKDKGRSTPKAKATTIARSTVRIGQGNVNNQGNVNSQTGNFRSPIVSAVFVPPKATTKAGCGNLSPRCDRGRSPKTKSRPWELVSPGVTGACSPQDRELSDALGASFVPLKSKARPGTFDADTIGILRSHKVKTLRNLSEPLGVSFGSAFKASLTLGHLH